MKLLFASIAITIPVLTLIYAFLFNEVSSSHGIGPTAAAASASIVVVGGLFMAYAAVIGFVAFPLIWLLSKPSWRAFAAINFGLAFLVVLILFGSLPNGVIDKSWSGWLSLFAHIGLPQLLLMAVWWWLVTQYKPSNKRLRAPIEIPPRPHDSKDK